MPNRLTPSAIRCDAQRKVCFTTSVCPSRKCKVTNKSTVPAIALAQVLVAEVILNMVVVFKSLSFIPSFSQVLNDKMEYVDPESKIAIIQVTFTVMFNFML